MNALNRNYKSSIARRWQHTRLTLNITWPVLPEASRSIQVLFRVRAKVNLAEAVNVTSGI